MDWSYLLRVLSKMGFRPLFLSWVRLFYNDPTAFVLVIEFQAETFSFSRGVRQGCPLSTSLYTLISETLACQLRASPDLRGLRLPMSERFALISQYTGDTTLLCTTDSEIRTVFEIYNLYDRTSGAKLNLSKCKGHCPPWTCSGLSRTISVWESLLAR